MRSGLLGALVHGWLTLYNFTAFNATDKVGVQHGTRVR